jgi:sporulation protein YlmC with PRC-barrel domain
MADDAADQAISYKALQRGVEVLTADGAAIGTVDQVLENVRENIFDGIVVRSAEGKRFVDAPEVQRITTAAVTLSIAAEQAAQLPPYRPGAPEYRANPRAGRLARLLGGGWRRR